MGTPSAITYAAIDIVRAIAQVTLGDHSVISANSLDDLKRAWTGLEPERRKVVVFFSDYPREEIIRTLRMADAPLLICAEGVSEIADFAMMSRGFGAMAAARFATNGIANLETVMNAPRARALLAVDKTRTLRSVVEEIIAVYRIKCETDSIDKAMQFLGNDKDSNITLEEFVNSSIFSRFKSQNEEKNKTDEEANLITRLARDYDVILEKTTMKRVSWPRTAFLSFEPLGAVMDGPLQLVGPARLLSFGPYLHLPAGIWTVQIAIEVRDCLSDNRLGIDIASGKVLAAISTTLPAAGVYACQMQIRTTDPMAPIEVRMSLLTGAIEGEILLHSATFTRMDELDEMADAEVSDMSVDRPDRRLAVPA